MLAKSKLNNIETYYNLLQLEFITILKEKDKHEKMKGNVRNVNEKLEEKQENMRVDGVNSSA